MTAPSRSRSDIPAAKHLTRVYAVFVGANAAVGFLLALGTGGHDPGIVLLVSPLLWAVLGQVITPFAVGHLLTQGPPVVSHDIVPRDIIGREVLFVLCLLLIGAFLAWRSAVGRWLSYVCVAALTLAVGFDLLGWIRQGL